jgi:hypothetical protein
MDCPSARGHVGVARPCLSAAAAGGGRRCDADAAALLLCSAAVFPGPRGEPGVWRARGVRGDHRDLSTGVSSGAVVGWARLGLSGVGSGLAGVACDWKRCHRLPQAVSGCGSCRGLSTTMPPQHRQAVGLLQLGRLFCRLAPPVVQLDPIHQPARARSLRGEGVPCL